MSNFRNFKIPMKNNSLEGREPACVGVNRRGGAGFTHRAGLAYIFVGGGTRALEVLLNDLLNPGLGVSCEGAPQS